MRRLAAIIFGIMSYVATFSCAAIVIRPNTEILWALTAGTALAFEIGFIAMKETLFSNIADPLGWVGFIFDAVINMGGILPWGGKILIFGPFAFILGLLTVNVADPTVVMIGGGLISLVGGALLSYAPHRLWRPARKKQRGKAEE